MSTSRVNPPTFRFPFEAEIAKLPPDVQRVHRYAFNGLLDLNKAIAALKSQITTLQKSSSSTSSSASSSAASSSSTSTGVTRSQAAAIATSQIQITLGGTNNQTATSYTAQNSDYGKIVTLNNASAIAVTLDANGTGIGVQWFTVFENIGAGTATLTPASGTINGGGSLTLVQNQGAYVFYDGTNWWAMTSVPGSGGTITAVVAGTGLSGGGSSGSVTLSIAATAVTPGSYTNANITVNAEGQLTAASNGSAGTTYIKGTVSIGPQAGAGTYTASGTVTGAVVGSAVLVGVSNSSEAAIFSNLLGWVSSTNTVNIQVTSNAAFLLTSLPVVVFN